MRVHSLFGLLSGVALLVAVPGDAAADLRTNASGRWQYVSALGAEYGRLMGQPALLLQSGSTLATLAGAPSVVVDRKGEDEDEDEGTWLGRTLSSAYVIVLAGVGTSAYLASELIGGDGNPGGGSANTPPTGGENPTNPPTSNPTTPTPGNPVTSPSPTAPPETTAPEPVTMTLLATGLAGLGGAQLRRRKKSSDLG